MVPARQAALVLALRGERRLVIGDVIGRGSQGTVYVARLEQVLGSSPRGDEIMARPVAVKIVDPAWGRDSETMHELMRAVRRSALVRHPNVVQLTDCFMASLTPSVAGESTPCIISELVDGMSLQAFVDRFSSSRRRVPLDLALFIACEIAEGLAAARSTLGADGKLLNMAHHELSARQVLLSWNGEVKVGDFGWRPSAGLVSGVRKTDRDIRSQLVHLSPEVARGARGDARSDVFSLGVMLHEMLYGPRFMGRGESPSDMMERARAGIVQRPIPSPLIPESIAAILDRAIEIDPRERHAHAGVLAYDLRREALALGVGDGRLFLRSALFDMSEGAAHDTHQTI